MPAPARPGGRRTGREELGEAVRRAARRVRCRAARQPLRRILTLGLPTAWGATALTYKLTCPLAEQTGLGARIATGAVFFAVGTGIVVHVRRTLLRELRRARRVAGAAQSVLLRPLPPRIDGLNVAAGRLCADREATVGGDLYEAVATEHGVRVVMGDVRGHGLGALATVAAVLGGFREAAHDEPDLGGVLRRLERTLARHLRERARAEHPSAGPAPRDPVAEEFVTLLLVEIRGDGEVRALNCGHPWPYLLSGTRVEQLARADPFPPLGPFPLPAELSPVWLGRLLPGEALFLHTDGAEDARDAHGRFFPLPAVLADAVRVQPLSPQTVLHRVFTALLCHTRGAPADDVALLVLTNGRRTPLGTRGRGTGDPAGARPAHPQPTHRG
ncbi:PP2C family protein-serine/threonine phosphatase [Streptomyces sp. NPDC052701]|uniref:PP2C family protein-serine/threonine phosphatase n=1 Tax=Streptomyces sp. NPDC052701 TaxID=3155533 RepID=UPI003414AA44